MEEKVVNMNEEVEVVEVVVTGTEVGQEVEVDLIEQLINSTEDEVDNSNLLDQLVHQGIYNDLEDTEPMTLKQILDTIGDDGCVSLDSTRPLRIEKMYNHFSYSTFSTKETTDKFGRIAKSEKVLKFKEFVDRDSEEWSEELEAVEPTFEIYLNDIELLGYNPMFNELTIYLNNGSQVTIYA